MNNEGILNDDIQTNIFIIEGTLLRTCTVRKKSGKHRGSSPVFPHQGITYLIIFITSYFL